MEHHGSAAAAFVERSHLSVPAQWSVRPAGCDTRLPASHVDEQLKLELRYSTSTSSRLDFSHSTALESKTRAPTQDSRPLKPLWDLGPALYELRCLKLAVGPVAVQAVPCHFHPHHKYILSG